MRKISQAVGLAAIIAAATASLALAQPREQPAQAGQVPGGIDPHGHSQTNPPLGGAGSGSSGEQQNMMGQGMLGAGAQRQSGGGSMPMMNMGMGSGAMAMGRAAGMGMPMGRLPMMKMMFAITDANGDGAVSFSEVTEMHKRMFDAVDANNDGRVTLEEIQSFLRD